MNKTETSIKRKYLDVLIASAIGTSFLPREEKAPTLFKFICGGDENRSEVKNNFCSLRDDANLGEIIDELRECNFANYINDDNLAFIKKALESKYMNVINSRVISDLCYFMSEVQKLRRVLEDKSTINEWKESNRVNCWAELSSDIRKWDSEDTINDTNILVISDQQNENNPMVELQPIQQNNETISPDIPISERMQWVENFINSLLELFDVISRIHIRRVEANGNIKHKVQLVDMVDLDTRNSRVTKKN